MGYHGSVVQTNRPKKLGCASPVNNGSSGNKAASPQTSLVVP